MIRTVAFSLLALLLMNLATAQDVSSARLFPPSTVVYAELADPSELVSTIFDHPLRKKIESLPPYKMAVQTPDYRQFEVGRTFIETHFGMSWREAVATFATQGVAVGLDAASEGVAVVVRGKDAASMERFRDKLIDLAQFGDNAQEVKSGEYRGIRANEINKVKFAVHGDRMVVTNQNELGQAVLDRLIDGEGASLADNTRFQAAQSARQGDPTAWAFVDIQIVRDSGEADEVYHSQIDNPVLELLVGGIQSTLKETPYATASLNAQQSGLGLRLSMPHQAEWIPEVREYFFGPGGSGRGPSLPATTQTLLTLSTYRDFSEMWLRAGDLFGEQTNDGFAQADANLTTLFAGRDFGEDILGSIEPEVGLVAARQDFGDTLPRPTIKVPAFALVLQLREPESMTRELRRIFQSLIGFLNVVGAMNGQNQLELEMEKLEGNVELISSSFVPEEDDRESTQAKIIFNFSPSVAFSGSRFVVSSTKDLAKELVLARTTESNAEENSQMVLNAGVLRQVLHDNRGQLIAQNMLEDGNTREEAEAIIDLLLEVVGYFDDASLKLAIGQQQLDVDFQIRIKQ